MALGSRLYHLKSWLTLNDAAAHLSAVFSESVAIHDVLHLGLEGRLKLSVLFLAPAHAIEGKITHIMDTRVAIHPPGKILAWTVGDMEMKAAAAFGKTLSEVVSGDNEMNRWLESGALMATPMAPRFTEDAFITWYGDVMPVEGVWDLPLLAGERVSVEELYSSQVGGEPELDVWVPDGAWIEREGRVYALKERFQEEGFGTKTLEQLTSWENRRYNPSKWFDLDRLPSDSRIVIRRQNLDAFLSSLDEQESGQPTEGEDLRALEAFGLLVELYASQHGPDHRHGARPNATRIVQDMLAAVPDDVTNMGDRKLKQHVGAAIKAWEAKKSR
ncbi:hypothetical protein [Halomonas sp. BC04]|uniref:hypothetical protein n=1 Tax=Halomonas sp. BC04 TaxID=1403540 RepID=UPI0003ED77D6|nr:hypothetical protein [Halomonas sp. BC04]EWH03566.1 hypothetical protein Q427_02560 [Halomonas sp. BC04]